jgi:hypothetical protein
MENHAKKALNRHRFAVWCGILLFTLLLAGQIWGPVTASNYEYTFLRGSPPGTLRNDRGSINYIFTGSIILLIFAPLTAAFMSDNTLEKRRITLHVVVVILLWVYFMVVMGIWANDYLHANEATAANAHNQANDERWCCINYMIPGSDCPNNLACSPPVPPAELVPNQVFLAKFWINVVFIIFLMIDAAYTTWCFRPAVLAYHASLEQRKKNPPPVIMDDKEAQRAYNTAPQSVPAATAIGRVYKSRRQ